MDFSIGIITAYWNIILPLENRDGPETLWDRPKPRPRIDMRLDLEPRVRYLCVVLAPKLNFLLKTRDLYCTLIHPKHVIDQKLAD